MSYTEFDGAAILCAEFLYESEDIQRSYEEWVQSGNDPQAHIWYSACVVLFRMTKVNRDIEYFEIQTMTTGGNNG